MIDRVSERPNQVIVEGERSKTRKVSEKLEQRYLAGNEHADEAERDRGRWNAVEVEVPVKMRVSKCECFSVSCKKMRKVSCVRVRVRVRVSYSCAPLPSTDLLWKGYVKKREGFKGVAVCVCVHAENRAW